MPPRGQQRVLVAGSRGVIGEALCRHFLASGHKVVGCSRSETVIDHEHFEYRQCDISDERAVSELFYGLDRDGVAPDIVILSAAVFSTGMVALLDGNQIDAVLATNVKGSLLLVREAIKRMMQKRYGRLIAISSISATKAERGVALYSMTKAALEQLIKVLPFEIGKHEITFNAVEIAMFEGTGMAAKLSTDARAALMNTLAVKRLCTSQDLCNAVEFFARPESSYVTGQILKLGFV